MAATYPNGQAPPGLTDAQDKAFGPWVGVLTDGQDAVECAKGLNNLTVIAGTGATVTVSRVDSQGATANGGGANDTSVAATTKVIIPVDWPWYYIKSVGGACRYALT